MCIVVFLVMSTLKMPWCCSRATGEIDSTAPLFLRLTEIDLLFWSLSTGFSTMQTSRREEAVAEMKCYYLLWAFYWISLQVFNYSAHIENFCNIYEWSSKIVYCSLLWWEKVVTLWLWLHSLNVEFKSLESFLMVVTYSTMDNGTFVC